MDKLDVIKLIFTTGASIVTYLFGASNEALLILVTLIVIDYATGLIRAYLNQKLNSTIGFKGILKKACLLFGVVLGHLIDTFLKQGDIFKTMIIYLFVSNEGLSIVENLADCGVPIPQQIVQALEKLKGSGSNEHN